MSEEAKNNALTIGGATVPDFLRDVTGVDGTEHITQADLRIPRIALAQKTSKQIEEGHPEQVPNLKFGMMYNDLTGHVYGKGPLEIVLVRADPPRYIEFKPIEEGGGVVDMNVPSNDPRTRFIDGRKPVATKFYDYVALVLPEREVIGISMKGTSLKTAARLNGFIKMRNKPLVAGRYTLTCSTLQNTKGAYAVFNVANSTVVDDDAAPFKNAKGELIGGWVSKELYDYAMSVHNSIKDKKIEMSREAEDVIDDSDPVKNAAAAATGDASFDTSGM